MSLTGTIQFDLSDVHPGPPPSRTVLPVSRPPTALHTVPLAEDCSPEELLDLSSAAAQDPDTLWSLLGSGAHVRAICRLFSERIEPALRQADKECDELQTQHAHEIRTLQLQLAEAQGALTASHQQHENERTELVREIESARDSHQVTALKLEYVKDRLLEESKEAQRLRDAHARLSGDAALARRFSAATLTIAKLTYLEVAAQMEAAEREERAVRRGGVELAEGSDVIVIDVPFEGGGR